MAQRPASALSLLAEHEELRLWNELWKRFDNMYYAYAARCGMSQSALNILYSMAILGEGCTQRQICDEAALPKTTVNSSVKKLVREGFLTCDPGPGRDVRLYLTEQGRALLDRVVGPLVREEAGSFTAFDSQTVRETLAQIESYAAELERRLGILGIGLTTPTGSCE